MRTPQTCCGMFVFHPRTQTDPVRAPWGRMGRSSIFGLLENLRRTPVQQGRPGPFCLIIWARPCLPGQACADGFREDQKRNFVPSAPRGEARGLLVFSGEKQTRRSNFGASGPRFTHLNTRHDARKTPKLAPPGPNSRGSWILAVGGTPTFSHFYAPLYIGAPRVGIAKFFRARETGSESSQTVADAPPASIEDDSHRVSCAACDGAELVTG